MKYEYDVAISFAGEDARIAKELAEKLKSRGIHVFYAEYEEAKLLGENLYEYLSEIYSKKSRYCIMIISIHYVQKLWTNHERKSAQERALKESSAYIIPVRIDDTPVPGLHETVLYFDLKNRSIDELVQAIEVKLGRSIKFSKTVSSLPTISIDKKIIGLQSANISSNEDFIDDFLKRYQSATNSIRSIDHIWLLNEVLKMTSIYKSYNDIQANYDKIVYGSKMMSNHEKAEHKLYLAVVHTKGYEFDAAHRLLREAIDIIVPTDVLYDLIYKEYLITGFICYSRKNDTNGLRSLLGTRSGIQNEEKSDIDYLLSIIYQEIFTRDINLDSLREVVFSLGNIYNGASDSIKPAMANSLGLAYRRLGERTGIVDLKNAIKVFRDGLELNYNSKKTEIELKDQMAITHIRVFELNKDKNELDIAESLIKECLELLSEPLDDPKNYRLKPRILNNYGNIYKQRVLVFKEVESASKAKSKYVEAEQYWNEKDSKYDWALLRKNIAETNFALGKITNDKSLLLDAIKDCIKSIKYRTLKNSPYQWGKTVKIVFEIVILLSELNALSLIPKATRGKILSFTDAILTDDTKWKENMTNEFIKITRQAQTILL